jgi:broad specificity phosphatase PhoE
MLISSSAGIRDSALTNHGVLQAERLGQYLARRGLPFTHLFSSDLQRALKTAEAIGACRSQQSEKAGKQLQVKQLPVLREQDFGFYEGKPFYARPTNSKKTGKENNRSQHSDEPGFQDVESKESMTARADGFVHDHLLPILCRDTGSREATIAVVSHGIILNHLWRSILKLFAQRTVTLAPGLTIGGGGGGTALEYLGGWSNTGYLELDMQPVLTAKEPAVSESETTNSPTTQTDGLTPLSGLRMVIKAVNGKEHLRGLKRTRGVSSGKHDEGQTKIDGFFKKGKVG